MVKKIFKDPVLQFKKLRITDSFNVKKKSLKFRNSFNYAFVVIHFQTLELKTVLELKWFLSSFLIAKQVFMAQ